MRASSLIGRVGGLAVALGVGAAVFSAAGMAWADEPAVSGGNASTTQSARTGPQAPAVGDAHRGAGSPRRAGEHQPRSAAARPEPKAAVRRSAAVDVVPARVSAAVSGAVTAAADTLGGALADSTPMVPVESPLDPTVPLYTRRADAPAQVPSVARAAAVSAAAAQPVGLVIGPSGVPIPSERYVETVMQFYVIPNSPAGVTSQVVFTPEGLYPITGVKSLPLNTSVDQGLTILSDTLALVPAQTPTTVFGYSQSAIIGSLLQAGFVPPLSKYPPPTIPAGLDDSISFVFVGNEMNPNGGLLSRFPGFAMPSVGLEFYGATPENAYPTTNYALEYDGFADFPRYPLNVLSVLNAGLGIVFVHTKYADDEYLTQADVTPVSLGGTAIELPTTSPTQRYFFMPTENLPLLQPLRGVPLIGNPLADLIQPALKVIVDLGYGDPAHGFSSGTQPDANVLTPFGLFPDVSPAEVLSDFAAGVVQGVTDFVAAFGPNGSVAQEISNFSFSWPALPDFALPTIDGLITAAQNLITTVANRISGAAAAAYAALLPTADIVNAIVTVLPAYAITLFLDGIQQVISGDVIGGLVNAIGLPIAASVGLLTTAALVEGLVLGQAVDGIVAALTGT